MSERETETDRPAEDVHGRAAAAFVEAARSRFDEDIAELYVFGSTARGDALGLSSDVDVLVVLTENTDVEATADALRDIAYDVMLDYGPVVELHILTEGAFTASQERGDPFIQNVVREGARMADDGETPGEAAVAEEFRPG